MIEIRQAESPAQIAHAHTLLTEYANALDFDLCFQRFDAELANLPGDYAPPSGRLLLAYINDEPAGSIALHAWFGETKPGVPHSEQGERIEAAAKGGIASICEMKRLYVRPFARGHNLGRRLIDHLIAEARAIGYTHMRLDTVVGTMDAAINLYREYGFYEIPPYRPNPQPRVLYFELKL
jgi:GNAT superfamily N-acetyltransferase